MVGIYAILLIRHSFKPSTWWIKHFGTHAFTSKWTLPLQSYVNLRIDFKKKIDNPRLVSCKNTEAIGGYLIRQFCKQNILENFPANLATSWLDGLELAGKCWCSHLLCRHPAIKNYQGTTSALTVHSKCLQDIQFNFQHHEQCLIQISIWKTIIFLCYIKLLLFSIVLSTLKFYWISKGTNNQLTYKYQLVIFN